MNINRCYCGQRSCGPVVALWRGSNGHSYPLCQVCLDFWLDIADKDPTQEPRNLWWINEEAA